MLSIEEYLRTSFHPDCDFVDGEVRERNVGMRRHSYALGAIGSWFIQRRQDPGLAALCALRVRVHPSRVLIPDVVVSEMPLPEEEVFTSPPYLCEVMSPDDTFAALQERLDEYLKFGVTNVWVIDPFYKGDGTHRGWRVTADGWTIAADGVMRTSDGRVAMPLIDVLLPS